MLAGVEISIDDVTAIEGDATGVFVDQLLPAPGLAGALEWAEDFLVGDDGNIHITSSETDEILRYDQLEGDLIDVFVSAGSGGLNCPRGLAFGTDGFLYVSSYNTNEILRFDALTGEYAGTALSGGNISEPDALLSTDDGSLYIANIGTNEVLRYDTGSGALDAVMSESDGLLVPQELYSHNDILYVASFENDQVLRFDGQATSVLRDRQQTRCSRSVCGRHSLRPGQFDQHQRA